MSSAHQHLSQVPENLPNAEPFRFGIVVSSWNQDVTHKLKTGALEALHKSGAKPENIRIVEVPGSYELTAGASLLLRSAAPPDAIICLGAVIQGETRHFDFICNAVANGLTQLTVVHGKPVIFGVLTTNTLDQALERAGGKYGNKGFEAGITAATMAVLAG
ncbi:MAG: 6,7-dimethyl-8-ribityllumazine synthase [Sphingobacteriales bacterium]|jgi:6,7-dimethyl-8-ribityllumazine synthase|nr:6,7-dimethyl-8-ribityllumazine synthase [Sphingobacteriales bacterium]